MKEAKRYHPPKITISLEDTLPLTYVTQRLTDILEEKGGDDGDMYGMETALRDFHRECLMNLGTCDLILTVTYQKRKRYD